MPHSIDDTPNSCYSTQPSVCPALCPFVLTESPRIQMVHRTIAIVTNSQSVLPVSLLHYSKPHSTEGALHNCYRFQQSVCPTCCPVALTESLPLQTDLRTFAIVTNSQSALPVSLLLSSKPHNAVVSPHNWYNDQQSFCPTCCPVTLTVCPTVQTIHRTVVIVTNSQSALPVALLH